MTKPSAWLYDHNGTPNAYAYQLPDWSPAKGTETPLYTREAIEAEIVAWLVERNWWGRGFARLIEAGAYRSKSDAG